MQGTHCILRDSARPSTNEWIPLPVMRLAAQKRPPTMENTGPSAFPERTWIDDTDEKFGTKSDLLRRKYVLGPTSLLIVEGKITSSSLPGLEPLEIKSGKERMHREKSAFFTLKNFNLHRWFKTTKETRTHLYPAERRCFPRCLRFVEDQRCQKVLRAAR